MSTSSNDQTLRETEAKRSNSLVEAKAKADSILTDVEELDNVINETRDWHNASDITVKKAMRNIENWKKEMDKIIERVQNFGGKESIYRK